MVFDLIFYCVTVHTLHKRHRRNFCNKYQGKEHSTSGFRWPLKFSSVCARSCTPGYCESLLKMRNSLNVPGQKLQRGFSARTRAREGKPQSDTEE